MAAKIKALGHIIAVEIQTSRQITIRLDNQTKIERTKPNNNSIIL